MNIILTLLLGLLLGLFIIVIIWFLYRCVFKISSCDCFESNLGTDEANPLTDPDVGAAEIATVDESGNPVQIEQTIEPPIFEEPSDDIDLLNIITGDSTQPKDYTPGFSGLVVYNDTGRFIHYQYYIEPNVFELKVLNLSLLPAEVLDIIKVDGYINILFIVAKMTTGDNKLYRSLPIDDFSKPVEWEEVNTQPYTIMDITINGVFSTNPSHSVMAIMKNGNNVAIYCNDIFAPLPVQWYKPTQNIAPTFDIEMFRFSDMDFLNEVCVALRSFPDNPEIDAKNNCFTKSPVSYPVNDFYYAPFIQQSIPFTFITTENRFTRVALSNYGQDVLFLATNGNIYVAKVLDNKIGNSVSIINKPLNSGYIDYMTCDERCGLYIIYLTSKIMHYIPDYRRVLGDNMNRAEWIEISRNTSYNRIQYIRNE